MVNPTVEDEGTRNSTVSYIEAWGGTSSSIFLPRLNPITLTGSPFPPTLLAAFIAAQHARPPQFLPLLFPPILLFSSYLNISNYKIDAVGISAAWSGVYLLLAGRRKQSIVQKWGVRGVIRGATIGLSLTNLVSGGLVYAIGKTVKENGAKEGNGLV